MTERVEDLLKERAWPSKATTMAEPSMSEHLRQMLAGLREAVRPLLPQRLRGGDAVVPVVRLSGAIGFSTPLRPGLTLASVARPLEARLHHAAARRRSRC